MLEIMQVLKGEDDIDNEFTEVKQPNHKNHNCFSNLGFSNNSYATNNACLEREDDFDNQSPEIKQPNHNNSTFVPFTSRK